MRSASLIFVMAVAPAAAQGHAPFCRYAEHSTQCRYYSIQACQQDARALGGMCGPAQVAPLPPPGIRLADFGAAGQAGRDAARADKFRRLARAAFEAKDPAVRDRLIAEAIEADPERGVELARFLRGE